MSNFTITVNDTEISALLKRLHGLGQNMQPIMHDIGEGIMERTKQRFATSTAPDGTKWLPNSQTTYAIIADRLGSKKGGRFLKGENKGRITAKTGNQLANKKPLIGESKDLMREFNVHATGNSVTIGNTMVYAAMQQFGGTTSPRSMIPNVKIPARPFLPVTIGGNLYPQERKTILDQLNEHLVNVLNAKT